MPAIAVCGVDKIITGHECTSVALITGGIQDKVKINGQAVAVQGDAIETHTEPSGSSCVLHDSVITGGSSKVSIGGSPVARIGDAADEGKVISGSSGVAVFIGA